MKSKIKDWLLVLLLFSDEAVALGLVLLFLWFFEIEISLPLALGIGLAFGTSVFIAHKCILPTLHKKKVTGSEGMIGLSGDVIEPLTPLGVIKVANEYWKAKAVSGDVPAGEVVEIVGLSKLTLEVKCKGH